MIFKYIHDIDNQSIFKYLLITFGIILITNRINITSNLIVGVIISVCVGMYLNDKNKATGKHFISEISRSLKTNKFKDTNYFYIDSNLVEFINEISEYQQYNPVVYRKLILTLDRFLKLVTDMEKDTDGMGELYHVIELYKTNALNTLHSMVYTIPQTEITTKKFNNALKKLEKILNSHLNNVFNYMEHSYSKKQINIDRRFIYKNHPKAYNKSHNINYDFY